MINILIMIMFWLKQILLKISSTKFIDIIYRVN